jgi:hypothetical protein
MRRARIFFQFCEICGFGNYPSHKEEEDLIKFGYKSYKQVECFLEIAISW